VGREGAFAKNLRHRGLWRACLCKLPPHHS
jgi:hypothetical protein